MDIKYRLYPHPVLWEKNDDFNNSKFDCDVVLNREIKKFVLDIQFNLDNENLKNLIRKGKAEYIIHIESPASSYRIVHKAQSENIKITLLDEHLLGKISLCPFIVAKEDISDYFNDDFNEDYSGVVFNLSKGTILAIGTQLTFKVDKENEDLSQVPSIFTIYKKETTEQLPIEIELNDNKIRIGLNIQDYENYYLTVHNNPDVVNAFLIYPVLIYTFERLKESFDDYSDYRWFKALEKMFEKYSFKLSDDIVNSETSIYLAQMVMSFPISKAFLSISMDEENGGEE